MNKIVTIPTVQTALADWRGRLEAGKSPATVTTYQTGAKRLAACLTAAGLDPATTATVDLPPDTLELLAVRLARQYGGRSATAAVYLNAGRSFWRYLSARRLLPPETSYEEAKLRLQEVQGRLIYHSKRPDARLPGVVERVLALPTPRPARPARPSHRHLAGVAHGFRARTLEWHRDRALLLVLWCSGMRVSEVVSLNRDDLEDGRKDRAFIVGKGGAERVVFFTPDALEAVRAYLEARSDSYRPLFLRHNRNPGDPGKLGERWRLESQSVWLIVRKYAEALGIQATPHSFRHHFASRLLSAGASVADVQKLLGHSSVAVTTKVYWHANTDALAEVYARFIGGRPQLRLVGPE